MVSKMKFRTLSTLKPDDEPSGGNFVCFNTDQAQNIVCKITVRYTEARGHKSDSDKTKTFKRCKNYTEVGDWNIYHTSTSFTRSHGKGLSSFPAIVFTNVEDRIDIFVEMKKISERNLKLTDLIQGLSGLRLELDENELVSKSPMRTHEYHHCSKPYECPQGSTSRTVGGITRVVEADDPASVPTPYQHFPVGPVPVTVPSAGADPVHVDVSIYDVNQWIEICNKNPMALHEFIAVCKRELSNDGDASTSLYGRRCFTTLRQYKTDGMSICSNSSSQISSPAQSPSELNVTSPESIGCEESSLFQSASPIIPSLECINIKPVEEVDRLQDPRPGQGAAQADVVPQRCANGDGARLPLNIAPGDVEDGRRTGVDSPASSEASSANIGTLMLNIATDQYESTIDLSQYTGTWDPERECTAYVAAEKEAMNKKFDGPARKRAWTRISQLDVDALGKGDKEGDSQLMVLLVNVKSLEYIYFIVERLLKEKPSYLSTRNTMNQDALFLAAHTYLHEPVVASYMAEALVRGKQDVNRKYEEGNTLLHLLVQKGDAHAQVLERLIRVRGLNNGPAFDVNKKNNRGYTPLHVACEVHQPDGVRNYQTVRVLLENGADCAEKEYKDENTPLHTLINESCDTELLRILLETSCKFRRRDGLLLTTIPNRQGNTALHLACKRNTLDIPVQKKAVEVLLQHGAMIQLKNINGCVPSVLVDSARKQEIKSSLHRFRQK